MAPAYHNGVTVGGGGFPLPGSRYLFKDTFLNDGNKIS